MFSFLKLASFLLFCKLCNSFFVRLARSKVICKLQDSTIFNQKNSSSSSIFERGGPSVIPFDFARDDVDTKEDPATRNPDPKKIIEDNLQKLADEQYKARFKNYDTMFDADARPSGYSRLDDDEDDIEMLYQQQKNGTTRELPFTLEMFSPSNYSTTSSSSSSSDTTNPVRDLSILQFLKDVYIGSPNDSRRRQQARSVIRSISLLSVSMGIIFTAVYYLAPGKFVSYRGDREIVATPMIISPDGLPRNNNNNNNNEFSYDTFGAVVDRNKLQTLSPGASSRTNSDSDYIDSTTNTNNNNNNNRGEYLDDGVGIPAPSSAAVQRVPWEIPRGTTPTPPAGATPGRSMTL
jgi:hypothetical protein